VLKNLLYLCSSYLNIMQYWNIVRVGCFKCKTKKRWTKKQVLKRVLYQTHCFRSYRCTSLLSTYSGMSELLNLGPYLTTRTKPLTFHYFSSDSATMKHKLKRYSKKNVVICIKTTSPKNYNPFSSFCHFWIVCTTWTVNLFRMTQRMFHFDYY